MSARTDNSDPESVRLREDAARQKNWKRWGPYLSERQWGTVREDYSETGDTWTYFPHDHARSRAYRWGEDGLLGICDRQGRICFALSLWNEKDPILKERLFGVNGLEGNHGEDVKELYYYLDATPTASYLEALYKYPQREYPYRELVEENRRRSRHEPEFELLDTGIFDNDEYYDVRVAYAKAAPEDLLVRISIDSRSPAPARLHVLPTLWFRNTWSWSGSSEIERPRLRGDGPRRIRVDHPELGAYELVLDQHPGLRELLFTENESNLERLFDVPSPSPYTKDAFHRRVVGGDASATNPARVGTKASAWYALDVPARGHIELRARLRRVPAADRPAFGEGFDRIVAERKAEADLFYAAVSPEPLERDERLVTRQAYAGLVWSKQFYHYAVDEWLRGDPGQPAPSPRRFRGRNSDFRHQYCRDVISMPDKWEYPWFAAWDLAFHMLPFARLDPEFAKAQLILFLREWYMHPNGQIPAYEFAFSDVNPPVHAWAALRVYELTAKSSGERDTLFLARTFHKLLLNFTWWVNRKDLEGNHLFSGGFLGLDNIGVFDRSQPLPTGGHLEQADGTAWMAFYSATMLSIALELARCDPAYEDVASKFFEHFIAIVDAMNRCGGSGLWCEEDGFYYDQLHVEGRTTPLRTRSIVGLLPLIAVEVLDEAVIDALPGFSKRLRWFLENRKDLALEISYQELAVGSSGKRLLAVPSRERLERVLAILLDEREFLSPFGIRSLSRIHLEAPYTYHAHGIEHRVDYTPGESTTGLFGGNSNWRGPVWFPLNYLIIEALERYHCYYGDTLKVEYPSRSGNLATLAQVAIGLEERLGRLFLRDANGARPCHGGEPRYARDPHFEDLLLFHEYFHGDDGRGAGASHQTGWTALVARCLEAVAARRAAR